MMSLCDGKVNKTYRVVGVNGQGKETRRLLELGIIAGQPIKIMNKSSLKKVFLVEIRGYLLSVRASILKLVQVA